MLRDKEGNRLYRRVEIKIIFPPEVFPVKKISQRAGPHQGFGPDGLDEIKMKVVDQLDTLYPWWNFHYVPLAPEGRTAKFAFVFCGYNLGAPATSVVSDIAKSRQEGSVHILEKEIEDKVRELAFKAASAAAIEGIQNGFGYVPNGGK
jgi:hypothetical protein